MTIETLKQHIQQHLGTQLSAVDVNPQGELTLEVPVEYIHAVCKTLRDDAALDFSELIDLCGVDYLTYGCDEWSTDDTTTTGFCRGVDEKVHENSTWTKPRFAVVYHLLSLTHNWRVRLRVFVPMEDFIVPSVVDIWACAQWFEREAFDLFGFLFNGHPDLRRLLTDYGFIGHPFRKDFPVSGHVEVRYDPEQERVIYQPVTIPARVLVPKVIRDDYRYDKIDEQQEP